MQFSSEQFQELEERALKAQRLQVANALQQDWPKGWADLSPDKREQRVDLLIKLCQGLDAESQGLESRVNALFIRFDSAPRTEDERGVFYQLITDRSRPLALRLERAQAWLGLA